MFFDIKYKLIITLDEARQITVGHNWSLEGNYLVDIKLQNLHSDEEFGNVKYIHNTTKMVHVQYPVLDTFSEGLLDFWLTTVSKGVFFICIYIFFIFYTIICFR